MIKEIVHDIVFLQQKALPAFPGDRQTALDLLDTLAAHRQECVGMAANMIGVPKAIIVVNLGMMDLIMFNPVILKKKHPYETEEGCLSLSGTRKTTRYREIQVEYSLYKKRPAVTSTAGLIFLLSGGRDGRKDGWNP